MADLNHVTLIGRLTRDAELKYTPGGLAISSFSIAVNRRRKNGDQWIDEVSYFDINLYGKAAESLKQYLLKGKQVAVDGELRQDRWECICSFIISQNNNIPRIKKIVTSLCEKYGQCVDFLGKKHYSFPTPEALLNAGVDEIFSLKTGFRAKYIIDACDKIVNGEINLDDIYNEQNFDTCVDNLCKIKGVGLKVAACALLFGFNKTEAFPIDVWIKRVISNRFNGELDISLFGKNGGIAQQYLFYYERCVN